MEIINQVDVSNIYDDTHHHHNYHHCYHYLYHRNQAGYDHRDNYHVKYLVFNFQEDKLKCA